MNGFLTGLDEFMRGASRMMGKPADAWCQLNTGYENILFADDLSVLSMIELRGQVGLQTDQDFDDMLDRLTLDLSSLFKRKGNPVQVVMEYDPHGAQREIAEALEPSRITARNMGFDFSPIHDDQIRKVAAWTASERVWILVWTRPSALSKMEEKSLRKNVLRHFGETPRAYDSVKLAKTCMKSLIERHHTSVERVMSALATSNIIADLYDAHRAAWWIRHSYDPEITSRNWRAILMGDTFRVMFPEPDAPRDDASHVIYPTLKRQIVKRAAENVTDTIVRIGDRLHAPLIMDAYPEDPQSFNRLFRALIQQKRYPWRVSFLLEGGGMEELGLKSMLAAFRVSMLNRMLDNAITDLRHFEERGGKITRFKISFDTWVDALEDNARQRLRNQVNDLTSAVQGWGAADLNEIIGDPLLGLAASVPGFMATSPAPAAAAPLKDALMMLPLSRPVSMLSHGPNVFRTPDGKIFPFSVMSRTMDSWIDLGVAPMGSSKSVTLNTLNFGFLTQPGLTELPFLSGIDIGPSSSGLISLIRSGLPDDQKHLAVYKRMRMVEEDSINPFDLPLGFSFPVPTHRSFLTNLLTLLATEVGDDKPEKNIYGLAQAAIDAAYDKKDRKPALYSKHTDTEVDRHIEELGIPVDEHTSWRDIADALFERGHIHMATRAQRFAVPVLYEVAMEAKNPVVASRYQSLISGEPIVEYFFRKITEAISAFPILNKHTQIDLGDARVISLDLNSVAPKGSPGADRQSAVMFMLARHILAGHFYYDIEDAGLAREMYREYQRERIGSIQKSPKRFFMDEVHRFTRNEAIARQVLADLDPVSRESRKWNLSIGLYSQEIGDIPEVISELASMIFVLKVGSSQMARTLCDRFGLNEAARLAMTTLGSPGPHGKHMLAIIKTNNPQISSGVIVQPLTNTLGPMSLWAFESSSDNRAIRDALYRKVGISRTLKYLARRYPAQADKEVERRRAMVRETRIGDETVDVIDQIVQECLEDIRAEDLD